MHNRRRFAWMAAALIAAAVSGCGYPKVSEKAYEISKALYGACNQQSEERLAKVSTVIEDSLEDGSLDEREGRWLRAIIATARGGDWGPAASEARRIMSDQVGR